MYHKERNRASQSSIVFILTENIFRLKHKFLSCHSHTHTKEKYKQNKWVKEVAITSLLRSPQKQIHKVRNCKFHGFQRC